MLTPERFNILYKACHDTKLAGIHDTIMPPPKSFASELLGLFAGFALHDNKTPMSTKIKYSYMRAVPLHFPSVLQKWTQYKKQMASPLDHNPKYLDFWSKDPHDRVFGAIPDAFHPNFLPSLYAILCMTINSCIVP